MAGVQLHDMTCFPGGEPRGLNQHAIAEPGVPTDQMPARQQRHGAILGAIDLHDVDDRLGGVAELQRDDLVVRSLGARVELVHDFVGIRAAPKLSQRARERDHQRFSWFRQTGGFPAHMGVPFILNTD